MVCGTTLLSLIVFSASLLSLLPVAFLLQGKCIAIFYGSQTGTAEEFAGRLAKDAQRYGLKALVLDPEECDMVSYCTAVFFSKSFQGFVKWVLE